MYVPILKSYNYTDVVHISICGLILGIAIHLKKINTASFYKFLIINFDKFYNVSLINHKSNLPGLYYNPALNFNIKFENNVVLWIARFYTNQKFTYFQNDFKIFIFHKI